MEERGFALARGWRNAHAFGGGGVVNQVDGILYRVLSLLTASVV